MNDINEILDKLEDGNFERPYQKMNYILQVRQYIKKLESENQELKKELEEERYISSSLAKG